MRYRLRTLLILLALVPPLLAVLAPPLMRWFAPETPPATRSVTIKSAPYFATYPTGKADPALVHSVVATLLAGTPDTRISLDPQTGTLVVLGPQSVQTSVLAIVSELQQGGSPRVFSAEELKRLKAKLKM